MRLTGEFVPVQDQDTCQEMLRRLAVLWQAADFGLPGGHGARILYIQSLIAFSCQRRAWEEFHTLHVGANAPRHLDDLAVFVCVRIGRDDAVEASALGITHYAECGLFMRLMKHAQNILQILPCPGHTSALHPQLHVPCFSPRLCVCGNGLGIGDEDVISLKRFDTIMERAFLAGDFKHLIVVAAEGVPDTFLIVEGQHKEKIEELRHVRDVDVALSRLQLQLCLLFKVLPGQWSKDLLPAHKIVDHRLEGLDGMARFKVIALGKEPYSGRPSLPASECA